MKTILSHAELQDIEHANKMLEAHLELVTRVTNDTEAMLNVYLPIMRSYVDSIMSFRVALGNEVKNILQSARELSGVAGHDTTQKLINFSNAIKKLDEVLTPDLVEKLKKIIK